MILHQPNKGILYLLHATYLYWHDSYSYTISVPNASFTAEFRKDVYKMFKYKMRSINGNWHSNGWIIEGSLDNTTFYELHKCERSLCHTVLSENACEESFNMTFYKPSRFIRVTQPEGECGGTVNKYFGLSAIDFYGVVYDFNSIKTYSCKHLPIDLCCFVLLIINKWWTIINQKI